MPRSLDADQGANPSQPRRRPERLRCILTFKGGFRSNRLFLDVNSIPPPSPTTRSYFHTREHVACISFITEARRERNYYKP